ncbi:MAG: nicotinamide-nucleotide amidohydrolase family protein [Proteobacteria bacterium]|nr:nicotinamide-nucleotide amidohydrolase family protein [Pseudomonadota bacterium]HQR04515.1 nicotinamide-nucleotide amidohydrolase family protein [Rhodocyclaceae bacterium]
MDADLVKLSTSVGTVLQARGLVLATAESCTGGWVAQVVTHTAGSSAWFDRGFVTYSNAAKTGQLGVATEILENHGAVSLATAEAMAVGALKNSNALISLSITGIAGPAGGSPDKPVGTVCFAWCLDQEAPLSSCRHFAGDRESVRRQAVIHALETLVERVSARTVP